jgi:1-acyl-sn-glycerol-3-phosphate acyltransferase
MAGYVRNDSTAMLMRESTVALREGAQLLIFPEGTRTVQQPVNEFKGGFALVAKKARVPVQTVFIEASSPFLGKHWSFFDKPEFPLRYTARLGKRFEVDTDAKTFAADLEKYYREQMTGKQS